MVAPAVIAGVIEAARLVFDRVLPDQSARAAAELELLRMQQAGTIAQIEVNKAEASTGNVIGQWRGALGWVLTAALAGQFVVSPWLTWAAGLAGIEAPPFPKLDAVLWELLFGMLGLGALQIAEKRKS